VRLQRKAIAFVRRRARSEAAFRIRPYRSIELGQDVIPAVIPAQAGIALCRNSLKLDPGVRRDDD
jgi:hypothetical protein